MSAVRNKKPLNSKSVLTRSNNSNASSGMNVNNTATSKPPPGTSVARNSPKTTPKTAKRPKTPANRATPAKVPKTAGRPKTPAGMVTARPGTARPGTVRRVAPMTRSRSRAATPRNIRAAERNVRREKTLKTSRGRVVKRAQQQTKVIQPPRPNNRVKLTNNSNTKTNNKNVKPNNARNTKTNNKNVKPTNANNIKTNKNTNNVTKINTAKTVPQSIARSKRIGSGISPKKLIEPEVLNEFNELIQQYEEKKQYVIGKGGEKIKARFEAYKKYHTEMCELVSFTPTNNSRKTFEPYARWIGRASPVRAAFIESCEKSKFEQNDSKVEEFLKKCFTYEFDKLFSKTTNKSRTGDIYQKIISEQTRLLEAAKDDDAKSALELYVGRNNPNQNLNAFIKTLDKEKPAAKSLRNMKSEYKILFSSLRQKLKNGFPNKINPINVAVNHGPANHNTLSQSSMIKILKNPLVLSVFGRKSLFAHFIHRSIDIYGVERLGQNKCSIRGNLDDCLLRRRVVFANVHKTQGPGNKAAQEAISAVNHGRMHRLKSFPSHGNTRVPGASKLETFQKPKQVKNYINAMKNKTVRNSELFKRNVNKLWQLQRGPGRTAVKYDENAKKLVKFDPANMKENPHILWTTFGLHLDQTKDSKTYKFFDFINYVYDKYNNKNTKFDENKYTRKKSVMGINYIIQLDSDTLTYLHDEFYFRDTLDKDYMNEIMNKLSSCPR